LLLVVASAFALVSIESLSKLWASYQDSPWWIYVGYGTLAAVAAIVCLRVGLRSLRRQ
jgi:hypothetical protein